MENIHSHMYSLLIDTYVKDIKERNECFKAIEYMPQLRKKLNGLLIGLIHLILLKDLAFVAVEGIFFSGSFVVSFILSLEV
jgi:ribonucleotide reductase beta subunit family protein with ferritin-like domain